MKPELSSGKWSKVGGKFPVHRLCRVLGVSQSGYFE